MSLHTLYFILALFLLSNLVAGMWRVLRGPTSADRMLAAQFFGTTSVAVLLLLAQATDKRGYAMRLLSINPLFSISIEYPQLVSPSSIRPATRRQRDYRPSIRELAPKPERFSASR